MEISSGTAHLDRNHLGEIRGNHRGGGGGGGVVSTTLQLVMSTSHDDDDDDDDVAELFLIGHRMKSDDFEDPWDPLVDFCLLQIV